MKAEDKHRWIKIEDDHTHFKCLDCGCEKERFSYTGFFYFRSGILFGTERPNCIKEEIESKKTIG